MRRRVALALSVIAFLLLADATPRTSTAATTFFENFDGVASPALPAGWSSVLVDACAGGGTGEEWTTQTSRGFLLPPVTPPNYVVLTAGAAGGFCNSGSKALQSPPIAITTAASTLAFRTHQVMVPGDAGVLEVSVNGGAFVDILASGSTFVIHPYDSTLASGSNPLNGRQVWTFSFGMQTTCIALAASMSGQSVRFRWRYGFDSGVVSEGWAMDNVAVNDNGTCATTPVVPTISAPVVTKSFAPATIAAGGTSTLTLVIGNNNAAQQLTNVSVTDNLPTGMTVANPPNVTHNCGGSAVVTATPGASVVSLTGGVIAANSTCTLSVSVTATQVGANQTLAPSAQESGAGVASNSVTLGIEGTQPPVLGAGGGTAPAPTPVPPPPVVLIPPPPIPQGQQNPAAIQAVMGGIGNGTRNNTPVPARPAVAPATGAMPVLRPPSTGDAGLVYP